MISLSIMFYPLFCVYRVRDEFTLVDAVDL